MLTVKVAGCALNQTPFDWTGNKARILDALEQARTQKVSVVCLPELCITGYGCEDAFFNPHLQEKALDVLISLLPKTRGLVASVGLPLHHLGSLFNCTAMIADGEILGFIAKKSLAGDGVHYEPRWFKAWQPEQVDKVRIRGKEYPFGDLHFSFNDIRIGFEICEEAWVAHRPGARLATRAVDIILNPSASHFAFGKIDIRKRFVCEGSRAFNVAYVYSNLLGNEAGRIIYDGGVLIADNGDLVACGPRFSFQDVQVTSCVVNIDRNRVVRARSSSYRPDLTSVPDLCIESEFTLPHAALETCKNESASWEDGPNRKEEEFTRAVSLGLFDFMRKSRQKGFVVSLSGGVDSAVVTILTRCALDLAVKELGLEGLRQKLSYNPLVLSAEKIESMASQLITCAYQATRNSSEKTLEAARAIAKDAGATFFEWSVDKIITEYEGLAESALSEKLSWEKHDLALQNVQARARGPAIWMIANLKGALLLSTSNRSEAAVGYATMDGDTCGGISPIAGIDKAFLRTWAKWIAEIGPSGLRPFKSFSSVLSQPPTAELRPQDKHQTDEDDLMPYEILDHIERLAIRDKYPPIECFNVLKATYPDLQPAQLKAWTAKFFRLWCRNQWKRERYAPAFHLDDESLDPKTWCRFPILSSGFEEEIAELEGEAK
jgi:NAD+ synthase (glutamine-hydrolysing)